MDLDMLLTAGTVIDGSGAPARLADVGVRDGAICYLGSTRDDLHAAEIVDCAGLVVAPGFIDIHTHSDLTVLAAPSADSAVLQGVTTQVTGNCGFSPFPVHPDRLALLSDHIGGIGGEAVPLDWTGLPGYADRLAMSPPAINVAPLVGHGALRIAAMDDPYGPADDRAIDVMCALLSDCLEEGAAGLSTGLTLPPSALADPPEIHALARVCARHDRIYATHARGLAGNELGAIDEAIEVTRATGVRLEYSHLALNNPANWGRAAESLRRFESAVEQGLPVGFDVYPYDASSSSAMQYLPDWVQRGGHTELAVRAADTSWRSAAVRAISEGFFSGIPWHWDRIVLSAAPGREDLVGLSFERIADLEHLPPEELLLQVCVDFGSTAQVVLHYRTEHDMQEFLAHPLSVVGSDGLARPLDGADHPHPRSFGAFPRVAGRYVRDVGLLDLPTAVRKMTGEPARRLGLRRRGEIAHGNIADLVIFDPAMIADQADFAQPRRPPVGVRMTVVAGATVAAQGTVCTSRPGGMVPCGR